MHHIVILGAGYAGLSATVGLAARTQRREDVTITLVSAEERFTERLRLHQVGTGQALADLHVPTLLAGTEVRFVQGWVTAIDPRTRTVRVDDERDLPYDTLVHALGAASDTAAVPGAAEHAHTFDDAHSAHQLATALQVLDERGSGTVLVAGSGLTGVEAAAEIAEQHPALHVVLAGRAEPGADLGAAAGAYLRGALGRLGVEVRTGEITKVTPAGVDLAGGESLTADAVLWTTGVRVPPLAANAGLQTDGAGRIVTDASLRSVSHPDVYAIGDSAAIRQGYGMMHGTCQGGMPTGVHARSRSCGSCAGRSPGRSASATCTSR